MLELQILVKWPHLQYNLNHVIKFCWWRQWQKLWRHSIFFKIPLFYEGGVAIFADIINIVTMFIKTIFKDLIKVKRIRNYVSKCSLYLYFLI